MDHFEFGVLSLAFGIVFPVLYIVGYQVRRVAAWSKRAHGPTDRIGFFVPLFAILGFAIGSLAQPLWSKGVECKAAGQPVFSCVFIPR